MASLTADSSQYELSLGNQAGLQSSNTDPYGQQRSFLPRSRIVYQALKGRKLEELSSTELSQILNDIEILVKDLSEELVNDLGKCKQIVCLHLQVIDIPHRSYVLTYVF